MIDITEKKVPHLFRNKYLRNAGSGSVSTSAQSPGQSTPGASVDIVKTDSATVPTDGNVLSALRALLEIRSRIIASSDTETALSEENTLSSFRIIAEIDAEIAEALEAIDVLYLSKTKADKAAEAITFLKGLFVGDNLAFINASGDAEVKNLVARMKAKVETLEVTGAASVESITVEQTATTLNLLVQELAGIYDLDVSHVATMFRTIIKDYVSSETFISGLTGEGMKLYKALNGDWNLEIDNIVIRKVMTIFELVISKIRAVNGGLVISAANGRIRSVAETTGAPAYYVLGIEGDNQFVADDLVRCQVFTSGQVKYYWVPVASVTDDSILILKSEFPDGVVPAIGDDLIQMGNRTNTARQGLLYLTASEDGKPRFSVMDGVDSTSTVGKSKVVLGCLDGMTDTDFPADFQPSGYGLYAMNVFLKGFFVLRNGKTVENELTATNEAVTAAKQIADAAKEVANSANALLSDIASDNKLTPSEKQATKKEWEQIVSEKVKNDASADKHGVSKVACTAAYNTLSAYITPLLASLATTSDIVGSDFRAKFKSYYDARVDLLNSISAKAKELADAAQGKATEASGAAQEATDKADAVTRLFQEFTVAGGVFESKIAEVKTYTDAAKKAAISAAALDAQNKANAAQAAAEEVAIAKAALAKTEASAYADGKVTAEEQRSIADAKAKLDEAKRDAQAKADTAKKAAISDAAQKYNTKSEVSSLISQTKNEINLSVTEKISNVQNQITTNASAIEVNRKGIALKASQSEVNGLGARLKTAESSLTVQAEQIAAQVSSVNALTGRMSSAEVALRPDNIWLGIKSNVSALVPTCTKKIDAKGLDANKYYLVTIGMNPTVPYTITVERGLDGNYGVPSYSTHSGGFSVLCKWQSNGSGWGAISIKRIIQTIQYGFVGSCPVGSISQISESSEEYIYVRGGSAYNVRVDGTSSANINLRTSTYTPYPAYPNSSRPGVVDSVTVPVVDLDTKVTEEQIKAGIGITDNGITVFGKFIDFTGRVTFNSMSSDAKNRITSAQNTANTANSAAETAQTTANNVDSALGTLRNSLGGLAYENSVTLAKLDSTIIDGGYIKTNLINARAIVTGALIAEQIAATKITTGKLTVTDGAKIGDFTVSGGSLSAEHAPGLIGFIYNGNSASLGAGSLIMDKSNTGYAIRINGGAGMVRMDIDTFEVIAKGGMSVTNSIGTALSINGKVRTNGKFGISRYLDVQVWNGGRWTGAGFVFDNGILTEVAMY